MVESDRDRLLREAVEHQREAETQRKELEKMYRQPSANQEEE